MGGIRVSTVQEGDDMPVSLEDGVQALAMAEAAQRSLILPDL